MILNFAAALRQLTRQALWRLANEARPETEYLFARLLPEVRSASYTAESGNMTVRTTMAGLVGTDSVYPPGGVVVADTFREGTAKIAIEVPLGEMTLRQIQQMLLNQAAQAALGGNAGSKIDLAEEALNFQEKVVLQAIRDTMEYLRGEALTTFAIDWTFNRKRLQVNYGAPAGHLMTNRTGTAAYGGSASAFWTDMRAARSLLRNQTGIVFVTHPDTLDVVLANTANSLAMVAQDAGGVTVRRYISINGQNTFSDDARDTVRIVTYDREGEILDPSTPGATIRVPFLSRGKILAVAPVGDTGYRVGQGATPAADNATALGYTHVGPTMEGDGELGIWSEMYTPQNAPWALHGRGAANVLPIIEQPKKLVVLSTDMPA